jgi:branched-chain amino acid transport system substrate-binding protein
MRRTLALAACGFMLFAHHATAQAPIKIGMILTMSGGLADGGRQILGGANLYLSEIGGEVGGRKIELIIRDDQGLADVSKRLAQEMVTQDKVAIISGIALTPLALAIAPVVTASKTPAVILGAGTSMITERSPYFVRASFTLPQQTFPLAEYVARQGAKTAVTLVSDYGPGVDAETSFKLAFEKMGGKVVEQLRAPFGSADYAPYLQRAADRRPDILFLFAPGSQGGPLMRQASERGILASGIKVVGIGDISEDQELNAMPDTMLGLVTSHFYSAAHPSALNRKFVTAFRKTVGIRPNFLGVSGYDGMRLMVEAIRKTGGDLNGDKLVDAMRGQAWESPRGPMSIDPETRDVIQDVYIRRVERKDGELYNIEFDKIRAVKDPFHGAAAAAK